MKKRTDQVLIRCFERTISSVHGRKNVLAALENVLSDLLETENISFLFIRDEFRTEQEDGDTEFLAELTEEKAEACLKECSGRPVCAFSAEGKNKEIWLFPMENKNQTGAVLCTLNETAPKEMIALAQKLTDAASARMEQTEPCEKDDLRRTAAVLSHEFKTPLTVAISSMQLIRRRMEKENSAAGDEAVRKYLDYAEQNLYKLLRLSGHILDADYAAETWGAGAQEYTDLAQTVKRMAEDVRPYALARGAKIEISAAEDGSCTTCCHPQAIDRILLNLISNALKHTPSGGIVQIAIRNSQDEICAEVTNDGAPIPQEAMPHLFERFWRGEGETEGSGLGLYLAKLFAAREHGSVTAENLPEGRVRFTLKLKRRLPQNPSGMLSSVPLPYRADSRRALLCEELSELIIVQK